MPTPLPLQGVRAFGVAAIVTPRGKVSVSGAVKVATLMFGLDSVRVRVDTLPAPALMVAGLKALPSVGTEELGAPHTEALTTLVSSVTAPVRANALPSRVAPVFIVMLVSARMFPTNVVVVPR